MNKDNDDIFNDIDPEVNHFAEIFPDWNNSEQSDCHSVDKFNENCFTNVNDLNIIHCNIRVLYAHHDEFLSLLSVLRVKIHILCFSESWLTDATKQLINFQGYQSFHSLRPINKRGGGISIFIKDSIWAKHLYRHSLSKHRIETLFVEINTGERTTYIGTIYKPPSADCNVFIDSIPNILFTINQSRIYDLMLCGDFYIDLLNKGCTNSIDFISEHNVFTVTSAKYQ